MPRHSKLPAPAEDGRVYVAEYILRRLEHQGRATLVWIDRAKNETGYVIDGRRYRYDGVRLAPKVNQRRRTFLQSILTPVED